MRTRKIKIYDAGEKFVDRFTVVFLSMPENRPGSFTALAMNDHPFHPQGFGQHAIAMPGKHLGKRIKFEDLPEDCKKLVEMYLKELGE